MGNYRYVQRWFRLRIVQRPSERYHRIYNKKTKDLIWNYPVSTNIYPFGDIAANVGEITNRGVEISINAIPVQTKDFTWNTTLTLSHNKNTVDRLSNDKFKVGVFTQGDPMVAGVLLKVIHSVLSKVNLLEHSSLTNSLALTTQVTLLTIERDEETGERTGNTIETQVIRIVQLQVVLSQN